MNIFTSDATAGGSQELDVTVGVLSSANVGTVQGAAGEDLSATDLRSKTDAAAALAKITAAVNNIASQRGRLGANINRLTAISNVAKTQQINLDSAVNSIMATDEASAISSVSRYDIVTQLATIALAEANDSQKMVTKLLDAFG